MIKLIYIVWSILMSLIESFNSPLHNSSTVVLYRSNEPVAKRQNNNYCRSLTLLRFGMHSEMRDIESFLHFFFIELVVFL